MKLLKISLLLVLLVSATSVLKAQKFGHLNSGNILVQLPETLVADSLLKIYQDSLITIGQAKGKTLQDEYMAFAREYQGGNVPPVKAQEKQDEFQRRQEELGKYEEEVIAMVSARRENLIGPILEKLHTAINEIAKEGGYTMIFDSSIFNTILFSNDTDDLEPMLKAKLGIN